MTKLIAAVSSDIPRNKADEEHLPGELGVWMFIFGDMIIFGIFFVTFIVYRSGNIELYQQSQSTLNLGYGAINTLVLLTSSWFVATAMAAIRSGRFVVAANLFRMAFFCGLFFAAVKFFEYGEKIKAGITLNTNEFFMFYYVFTGIHFFHLILGMVVLALLASRARKANPGGGDITFLEGGATFWHLIDLLWIVLFPLLYVLE